MKKMVSAVAIVTATIALGGVSLFAQTAPVAPPNVASSTTSTTTTKTKKTAKKQTKSTVQAKSTAGK